MSNPEIQPMLDSIGFAPDTVTSAADEIADYDFELFGNYPNPFNPGTTIKFNLPSKQNILIKIFNSLGEEIKNISLPELNQGENKFYWDGTNSFGKEVNSGIYFYSIMTEQKRSSGKMVLIR